MSRAEHLFRAVLIEERGHGDIAANAAGEFHAHAKITRERELGGMQRPPDGINAEQRAAGDRIGSRSGPATAVSVVVALRGRFVRYGFPGSAAPLAGASGAPADSLTGGGSLGAAGSAAGAIASDAAGAGSLGAGA